MAASFSMEALKEPRGFIRLIEFILAIFAFATVCSFTTQSSFSIKCQNASAVSYSMPFSYPFSYTSNTVEIKDCNPKLLNTTKVHFAYGPKAPSEFYVFVGVVAMLYTVGVFVLYVFFDDLYRKNNYIVVGDFLVTAVWTFLWLLSSSIWAQGVVDLKTYTDPTGQAIFGSIFDCTNKATCTVDSYGNFAGINVSVVFGFLNMVVWGGNCWFLYKETPWFKKAEEDFIPEPGAVHGPPSDTKSPAPLY